MSPRPDFIALAQRIRAAPTENAAGEIVEQAMRASVDALASEITAGLGDAQYTEVFKLKPTLTAARAIVEDIDAGRQDLWRWR